jgi:ribosome-binding protein aMBF1 (putative translation factor)
MDHQDWKPVVLNKTNGPVIKEIVEKKKQTGNSSVKLDENDEIISIKKVPKEISQLITNARIAKKLTRKDLANNLNLQECVITEIETGKAIYDGNLITKIKKYLCVK